MQGLRASRKLKSEALSLYVGNGQREVVEAIGIFYLSPEWIRDCLKQFYYAPSITRGVIFVSRLYEDDFINRFVNNTIQVSRNNMVYFSAIPRDGIFEIDLSDSYTNESSIYVDHGIIVHRTPPYMPQHNRVSERRNRTLLDMVRSMMSQTTLPKSFQDYALETATRILNMVPTKKVEKIPYENSLITQEASRSLEVLEIIQEEDMHPSIDTSLNHEKDDPEINEPQSDIVPIRRSTRTQHAPDRMCLYIDVKEHELGDLGEPANYKAALLDPESEKWLNAMNVEMKSMKDNEV
nr:retrotransposon protein, putative, Ty1-copia subclass [Tanacetum cinerariifolium]